MKTTSYIIAAVFVIIASYSNANFLNDFDNLHLKLSCINYCTNSSRSEPTIIQNAVLSCQMQVRNQICQDLEKNEPEFLGHLKKCKATDLCKEHLTKEVDQIRGCKNGFLEGTGENFSNIYQALSVWGQNISDRMKARKDFIELCEKSLPCKKLLVENNPKFKNVVDGELSKYSAVNLLAQMEEQNYIRMTQQRQLVPWKTALEIQSPAPPISQQPPNESLPAINISIVEWLTKKKARLDCLDAQTRAEMICWGVAYILDPLIVINAAKGSAIARYVVNLASDSVRGGLVNDGETAAKVGNYTFSQLLEKARILKAAGIERDLRRILIREGRVGDGAWIDEAIVLDEEIKKLESKALRSNSSLSDKEELSKLRSDLDKILDSDHPEDQLNALKEKLHTYTEKNEGLRKESPTKPSLSNVQEIKANEKIPLNSQARTLRFVQFSEKSLQALKKAENHISTKLLNALNRGAQEETLDPSKVRILKTFDSGEKGVPFEVVIINRGHQRLFGCLKDGVFNILAFDPEAPADLWGTRARYGNLCK